MSLREWKGEHTKAKKRKIEKRERREQKKVVSNTSHRVVERSAQTRPPSIVHGGKQRLIACALRTFMHFFFEFVINILYLCKSS